MAENYGLVRVMSNSDVEKSRDETDLLEHEEDINESSLSAHIRKNWEINRQARENIEDEMLKCLRQKRGEYDPDVLAQIHEQGGSEIYMKLTTTKIRAAISWITDIMSEDRPWGLEPTPIPELPKWAITGIITRIKETMGMQPGVTEEQMLERAGIMRDEALKALKEIADDASDRMEQRCEDQMAEGGWDDALKEFIDDFCTFPAAFLKGPVMERRHTLKWGEMDRGGMTPIVTEEIGMTYKRVSPFDMYPGPDATKIDDGNLIERERYSRKELYRLREAKGYNKQAIESVLDQYGRAGLKDWLWRDYERAQLEDKDNWWLRSDSNMIDGIHFYGSAQGISLLEWGINPKLINDPLDDYEIDAILIGTYVIRAVINKDPLQRRPYRKACYQNVPGSFWGLAIPYLMRDDQKMCNASGRALANNLGIASGPQVEVNIDRLPPGEPVTEMYPWKIWQTNADHTGANQPAVRFFMPDSNAAELMSVFEFFEKKADDSTNIPRYTYGNEKVGGAGSTMGGLSMLMTSAAKGIKNAILNIDTGVIKPTLEMMFTHNMMYDPDPTIKGDCKVVARGSSAILIKETNQMRRQEFLQLTNNPVDLEIIGVEGRTEILREVASPLNMNTDKIVPTREDMRRKMEEAAKQPPPKDPALLKIEAQAQLELQKREQDQAQHMEEMNFNAAKIKEQGLAEMEKNRERMAMEERLRKYQIDQEIKRQEAKAELDKEKMNLDHKRDMEKLRKEMRLQREKQVSEKRDSEKEAKEPKETTTAQPAAAAPVINLNIDNTKGTIKKKLTVERGKDGKIAGGESIETPMEETE